MSSSSSDSQANQTQSTTSKDNRIVSAAGSVNFADSNGNSVTSNPASHNTTVYQSLDAGAVGSSFDFANQVAAGAASTAAASLGAMQSTTKDALGAVGDAYAGAMDVSKDAMGRIQDMAQSSNASVSSAWKSAVGAVTDNSKASISAISTADANALQAVQKANSNVVDALANAWQESKAGDQKMVAYAVMAVLGVVALGALRK